MEAIIINKDDQKYPKMNTIFYINVLYICKDK